MNEQPTSPENLILDFSAKDPVCGMIVDPPQARGKAQYRGDTYYFCSPGCMHKFTADPAKYVAANGESVAVRAPAPVVAARRKPEKDPVCGMTVDPATAASSVEYERKLYHFCSRGCAEKFQRDAKRYLDVSYKPAGMPRPVQIGNAAVQIGAAPAPTATDRKREKNPATPSSLEAELGAAAVAAAAVASPPKGTAYVCPMDPEVHQHQPGACPK
jgi:P-type Cu+ transporter